MDKLKTVPFALLHHAYNDLAIAIAVSKYGDADYKDLFAQVEDISHSLPPGKPVSVEILKIIVDFTKAVHSEDAGVMAHMLAGMKAAVK